MPELPEVEMYTRYFARHALKKAIARVVVRDPRVLGEVRKEALQRRLRGRSFTRVRRHGKHLFVHAGEAWLRLHFGMTGDLAWYDDGEPEPRFARVVFDFRGGGHLAFQDMRLFGVVDLIDDPDAFIASRRLGPDPFDANFDLRVFKSRVGTRRGAIKAVLMSQEAVAGLGNLYVDEILFQTSIHPRRPADRIVPAELRQVFTAMRRILRDTIARQELGADDPARYLISHRESGTRCPRCGGTIRRAVVFGRTTYFCTDHQK